MKFVFFLAFIFLFSSFLFSYSIYTSNPQVGQRLEILAEGAGNDSIEIIAPDGSRINAMLVDGQYSLLAEQEGTWIVNIGGQRKEVEVKSASGQNAGRKDDTGIPWVGIFLSALVLVLASMALLAALSIAFPPAPKKWAWICKRRDGNFVCAIFCAGSRPLNNVELYFNNGMKTRSKKLEAFEKIQIRCEYEKEIECATARWEEGGKARELSVRDGIAGENEDENMEKSVGKTGQEFEADENKELKMQKKPGKRLQTIAPEGENEKKGAGEYRPASNIEKNEKTIDKFFEKQQINETKTHFAKKKKKLKKFGESL